MKKETLATLIISTLVILFVMMISLTVINKYKHSQKIIVKTKIVKQLVNINRINKPKFADWIYRNSFKCSRKQALDYANIILKYQHPLLIASIMKNESSYNVTAYNKVGTTPVIGLMQIYCTQDHIKQLTKAHIIHNVRDLFSPQTNIRAGVFLLNDILKINNNNILLSLKMYCGNSKGYAKRVLETLGQLTIEVKGE